MTVLEVLTAATDYLRKQEVESPRLNAEHLLAKVLGKKNRIELYLDFERPLGDLERAPLRDLVRRRGEGTPLQHLLGTVDFLGLSLLSDPRALIPRPETEQLVGFVLAESSWQSVWDIGTGTGAIALALATKRPSASVAAGDVSADALSLARENAARLELAGRVSFFESDLLEGFSGPVEAIVANLPYIPTGDIAGLSREVGHDPVLALDGGADGLALIRRLAAGAAQKLPPGGLIALEVGHDQAARTADLLAAHNFRDISVRRDYQGIERFLIARNG